MRKTKHVKTFEYEKVTVNVHYDELPTKEKFEDACAIFHQKAMRDIEESENKNQQVSVDN